MPFHAQFRYMHRHCNHRFCTTIGLAVVIPSWIIYIPTQARDMDGMWGLGIFMLPFVAFPVAGAAALGRCLGDA